MAAHSTLNIHLPERLYREIAEEARRKKTTKGAVARQRLSQPPPTARTEDLIGDLFGIAEDLPADLSERKDAAFERYGRDGHR